MDAQIVGLFLIGLCMYFLSFLLFWRWLRPVFWGMAFLTTIYIIYLSTTTIPADSVKMMFGPHPWFVYGEVN